MMKKPSKEPGGSSAAGVYVPEFYLMDDKNAKD